jgi:hypothetical protein
LAYAGKRAASSHSVASGGAKHNRLNFKSIFAEIEKKKSRARCRLPQPIRDEVRSRPVVVAPRAVVVAPRRAVVAPVRRRVVY